MDKEAVVHIHNGRLAIRRNAVSSNEVDKPRIYHTERESVLMRWTNLESIIQSEVSKRKINIIL